jgi:hypothetical protein
LEAEVEARTTIAVDDAGQRGRRVAGFFVLCVLLVGCVTFWIGVPLAFLWGLGKATDDATTHFVVGLLGAPLAMAAFSPILFWLNGLYLSVTGLLDQAAEDEEETGWQRRVRGPLEPILMVALAIAIVALCIWFFGYAENPPRQVM